MWKCEQEKALEDLGIKVRDENNNIRSKDDIAKDLLELLRWRSYEDYIYLMMILMITREMDRPFP